MSGFWASGGWLFNNQRSLWRSFSTLVFVKHSETFWSRRCWIFHYYQSSILRAEKRNSKSPDQTSCIRILVPCSLLISKGQGPVSPNAKADLWFRRQAHWTCLLRWGLQTRLETYVWENETQKSNITIAAIDTAAHRKLINGNTFEQISLKIPGTKPSLGLESIYIYRNRIFVCLVVAYARKKRRTDFHTLFLWPGEYSCKVLSDSLKFDHESPSYPNRSSEPIRSRSEKYRENQCESTGNLAKDSVYWMETGELPSFDRNMFLFYSWNMRIIRNICCN